MYSPVNKFNSSLTPFGKERKLIVESSSYIWNCSCLTSVVVILALLFFENIKLT